MFVTLATLKYYFKSLDYQMKITYRGIGAGKGRKPAPIWSCPIKGESPISEAF